MNAQTQQKTAADFLPSKDDGFPRTENGRIFSDAYDLIGVPEKQPMNTTEIEAAMAGLAKLLGEQTGETGYCLVRLDVNISGKLEWNCYTPSGGWCAASTFEAALNAASSKESIADKMRRRAAEMLAEADRLSRP